MPSPVLGEERSNATPSLASEPPMSSTSQQTPGEGNVPLLYGVCVENVTNTLLQSIVGSGPVPGSSKQTTGEDNAPQLDDIISVGNVTNTLLRPIVGSGSTG